MALMYKVSGTINYNSFIGEEDTEVVQNQVAMDFLFQEFRLF